MTARISLQDAMARGFVTRPPTAVPLSALTPAARRLAEAMAPSVPEKPRRRSAKGGRHVRIEGPALDEVSFRVEHEPRTKQRARTQIQKAAFESAFHQAHGSIDRFRGLMSGIRHRSYTPKETEEFERLVGETARAAMRGRTPFQGPVEMEIDFEFEGDPREWPTDVTDADLDNAVKAILDGLNGIAFRDDRLVVRKRSEKRCAAEPGIDVVIRLLAARPRKEKAAD
jgi:Holliday junction resolvase RusA-like endonuclease